MRRMSALMTTAQGTLAQNSTTGQNKLAMLATVLRTHRISLSKLGLPLATPLALQRCDQFALTFYI